MNEIEPIDVAMFGKCRVCHAATDKGAELCEKPGCTEIWRAGEAILALEDDTDDTDEWEETP